MISIQEAFRRMKEGNARFVAGRPASDPYASSERRAQLAKTQEPFAVLFGCSDSRVPAELVFDCGLGDLFVIRVAGNVVAPSLIGSVEFAVEKFGTPLVVVMGHSTCGAVTATYEELTRPTNNQSPNLLDIVKRVRPSMETLLEAGLGREDVIKHAVRANVRLSVDHLRHGSRLLEDRVDEGRLLIVGAEYSLDTGVVDFFEGAPETAAPKVKGRKP